MQCLINFRYPITILRVADFAKEACCIPKANKQSLGANSAKVTETTPTTSQSQTYLAFRAILFARRILYLAQQSSFKGKGRERDWSFNEATCHCDLLILCVLNFFCVFFLSSSSSLYWIHEY
jgi:hypothetical protein